MLPANNTPFAPVSNPGQSYLAMAAQGRMSDAITEVETGLAELLRMQNAALARIDHLIARSGSRTVTRAASADNAQSLESIESMRSDITRCRSCGNIETITTQL